MGNSLERVQNSFRKFGFFDDAKVKWIKGYFNESLPRTKHLWTSFAVVRLDGDTYQSVMDGLVNCYPFLSEGGYVIIDDYTDWIGARLATQEFLAKHNIAAHIYPVYHGMLSKCAEYGFKNLTRIDWAALLIPTARDP